MSRLIFLFSFVTILLLLTPSTVAEDDESATAAEPTDEAENAEAAPNAEADSNAEEGKEIVRGNNEFTKKMYEHLAKNPGNVVFSPISIHAILSLTSQGAGDKHKEAFSKVLNVSDLTGAAEQYDELMNDFENVETVRFLMANKVFVGDTFSVRDSFEDVVTKKFHSEVQRVDFSDKVKSAEIINDWAKKKTNNSINGVISSGDIESETRLVLVNAVYFKNHWLREFKVKDTKKELFYVGNGQTIEVQMMHNRLNNAEFKFDIELDAKILDLPYYYGNFHMIVILPNNKDGIEELEEKLGDVDLTKITDDMDYKEVILSLPKFVIEQTTDLKTPLSKLGLKDIFSEDTCDLTGMVRSEDLPKVKLHVSNIIHKVILEVNEEGTEAAATTREKIEIDTAESDDPLRYFEANHPFIIFLITKQEGSSLILFEGRISAPKYKESSEKGKPIKKHKGRRHTNKVCSLHDALPSVQLIFLFALLSYFTVFLEHHAFC